MDKGKKTLLLFVQFLKFGCFTFGGGYSIIAQMQKIYVEERHTITNEEILDLTSVGRSLPGTMIGNIAMLFGYRESGVLGGIACLTGMVLPPMVMLSVITLFYNAFRNSFWVAAAMSGVRAAVVPIIFSAALNLIHGAYRVPPCILVTLLIFVLYSLFNVSCIWLMVIGAACGLAISGIYEKRGTLK